MIAKYLIVIIISIFFIFCINQPITEGFTNNIPKIIWTYWDKKNLPEIVRLCQKNWKKFAPNYKINFLNKEDVNDYVDLPEYWRTLPPYRQSDIIRLKLLEKYGGVWMDASILLLTNPDNFIEGNLTLFTTPGTNLDNPVYENWFIASSKGNPVIKKWLNEVLNALNNKQLYISDSDSENVRLVGNVNYLICHLCLRNLYKKNKNLFKNGKYYESNTTAFHIHNKNNWKNINKNLFKDFYIDPKRLMIKMRGSDRKNVKNIHQSLY